MPRDASEDPLGLAWKERVVRAMVPRLAGDDAMKEQSLEILFAAMELRHSEGIKDAVSVVEGVAEASTDPKVKHTLDVLVRSLNHLIDLNNKPLRERFENGPAPR